MLELPVPPSKDPRYIRAYYKAHYSTICAAVPRPFKEEFRRACQSAGKSVHAVLIEKAAEFIQEQTPDHP